MKINSLVLHNFGIYGNTNRLDLNNNKPVVLIGGMNGRGKTTILEAVLLALYGRRSFAFGESKISFPKYLNKLLNKADGSYQAYVELSFSLNTAENEDVYNVRREWSLHSVIPTLHTIIHKNNTYDQVLSDNWDLFVEEILPSAIAPFFFFDGEKISELATSGNDTQMKDSIKTLLGIDVIDQAIIDVKKIIKGKQKTFKANDCTKEIADFEKRCDAVFRSAKEAKDKAGELNSKKIRLQNALTKVENNFAAMGGSLAASRMDLKEKKEQLDNQLATVNEKALEMAAGDLPLLMVIPLLKNILADAEAERQQKEVNATLEQLPALYQAYQNQAGQINQFRMEDFLQFIKSSTKETPPVYNLTENGYTQLKAICALLPEHSRESLVKLLDEREKLLDQLAEVDNYLSVHVDEEAAGKLHDEILQLTRELATVTEQHRQAEEQYTILNMQYEELEKQQLKLIEKAVEQMEDAEDSKRIVIYAGYTIDVLEKYKVRLQENKTRYLAATMSNCFRHLAAKQNLIQTITIDGTTLDFTYLDKNDQQVPYNSLSAGEKQLLVIAMLWALGICSQKKLPVIIDTPLARLDSAHREALICNYFSQASEQTILLSTDSEVAGVYYQQIKPYVDKEFLLVYDDENKQSIIQEGYFGGEVS